MGWSKAAPRSVSGESRRQIALRLRAEGATYVRIGDTLGVSKVAAFKLVKNGLKRLKLENEFSASLLRTLEVDRLDSLWSKAWAIMEAAGKDPRLRINAVRCLIRISGT